MGVDQMVSHRLTIGQRWLRGSDVHPPVEAEGIRIDDLHVEALRQIHGQGGLARRRGTDQRNDQIGSGSVRHLFIVVPILGYR